MDDFLGTSIQYSELQIKLLEKEHYENQQKIVEELISSGFLDSDYEEESTETEFESTDNESTEASLEIKENELESPSSFEYIDDSKMNISTSSLIESSEEETIMLSSPSSPSSPSSSDNNNNLNMVLPSDISVVDEFNVSNSESINDATINQIIHNDTEYTEYSNIDNEYEYEHETKNEYENEYSSDDQIQEIQQFDIVTSKAVIRFMEFVFSDIKYLMILFILMVACPHIIDRVHQHENDNDMPQFYGGGVHSGYRGHNGCYHQRTIHWNVEPYYAATTHSIINDEDDERDEYQNDDNDDSDDIQHDQDQNEEQQCIKKQHILSFDIMTTTFDMNKKVRRAHLEHHEFKITPSDLCNGNQDGDRPSNMRMRMRNLQIPREVPRLFMNIGGLSSMRGFKSTSIASVRRHLGQTQGFYALVMAFVGIAGFAASNNIDEIMSITISS